MLYICIMEIPTKLEDIQKELKELKEKNIKRLLARKKASCKYQKSKKGRDAIKRANQKYYKPTGRKVGRPRKCFSQKTEKKKSVKNSLSIENTVTT